MRLLFVITILLFFINNAYATNYYVKNGGDDTADGLSDATAWETVSKVNSADLKAGDVVHFKRGSVWREQLIPQSGDSSGYITYTDYGEGDKPLLLGSVEKNDLTDWTEESTNIWYATDTEFSVDVGNIIFDDEASVGIKVWEKIDLDTQDEFWYDEDNDRLYMYSVGNPASVHSDIECALRRHIISETNTSYVKYINLDLRYGGAHGIGGYGVHHIIIYNCHLSYIGGGDQYGGDATTRYGNGIEFWGTGHDIVVERCRIDNIYDAGVTHQGNSNGIFYNIYYKNNLISNCEYSFEYWNRDNLAVTHDIYFENNTCINAGGGWGHNQRPDSQNGRHLMIGYNPANCYNFYIKNNIFYEATESSIRIWDIAGYTKFIFDNNLYYNTTAPIALVNTTTYTMLANWQSATNQDLNSISADPLLNSNYIPQSGSPVIDAGAMLREVCGTKDYRGLWRSRDNGLDIGAIEYFKLPVTRN